MNELSDNTSRLKLKKKELLIFSGLLIAALIAWFILYQIKASKDYGSINILVENQLYGSYDLGKDQVIKINDTNVCTIEHGVATMTDASCPDHLCMYQMPIAQQGGMIICLPNNVIIEGVPAEDAVQSGMALDALS